MPIYEYQCDACSGTFEAIQKFSDDPLSECRLCGAASVRKLVSAPAFRLKGSGWYETDFKKDKQKNLAKGEGGGESKASDGDAKPAEKKADSSKDSSKKADAAKPAASSKPAA